MEGDQTLAAQTQNSFSSASPSILNGACNAAGRAQRAPTIISGQRREHLLPAQPWAQKVHLFQRSLQRGNTILPPGRARKPPGSLAPTPSPVGYRPRHNTGATARLTSVLHWKAHCVTGSLQDGSRGRQTV